VDRATVAMPFDTRFDARSKVTARSAVHRRYQRLLDLSLRSRQFSASGTDSFGMANFSIRLPKLIGPAVRRLHFLGRLEWSGGSVGEVSAGAA
jgi:hypothetical protein